MGKITFRADDDLVEKLETFDASKSEVMREALRSYLERHPSSRHQATPQSVSVADDTESIDDLVRAYVDERLDERLDQRRREPQEVTVTVSPDEAEDHNRRRTASDSPAEPERKTVDADTTVEQTPSDDHDCEDCGTELDADHVFCPNCGEKASRRTFCECGGEVRSDWAFCPECGRRTPAADVLDSN